MIRSRQFVNGRGSKGASRYFTEELSASDYYAKGVGQLGGKELWRLGLDGRDVDQKVFEALEKNLHPVTRARLTPRMNGERLVYDPKTGQPLRDENGKPIREPNRRTGRDICFVVPKTVSEYMAFNPGERAGAVERMIYASWAETMEQDIEPLAQVRERKGGAQEDRTTGNLIYFSVVHRDARPEAEVPDPYFHIHTYCFNLTWDPEAGRFMAAQMGEIVRHLDSCDAFFLARLEARLRAAGFGTERTQDGRGFELTGVSKEAKDILSKRHARIVQEQKQDRDNLERMAGAIVRDAAKRGKVLDFEEVLEAQRDRFAHARAKRKVTLSPQEKFQKLREQMTPELLASLSHESVTSAPSRDWRPFEEAKREVVAELFKNQSVAHELAVAAALVRATGGGEKDGNARIQEALAFARSGAFVQLGGGNVTTQELQREERRMRAIARRGWDRHEPPVADPDRKIQNPLVASAPDQANAVRHIWRSRDLLIDVSGLAGAGKTTMLQEAVPAIRETRQAILLAPTTRSMRKLREAFPGADTLQNFLLHQDLQEAAAGSLIVLDEASMVSVPQMSMLIAYAEQNGCRILLCGDTDQHHAVERGDALRILEGSGAVRWVELTETYRAKDPVLRQAVKDWKAGRREEAYDALEQLHNGVREVLDPEDMRRQAIELHLEAVRAGQTCILGCPLHAEAREAAKILSDRLIAEGLIGAEAHQVTRLDRLEVEGGRSDPILYQEGHAVSFLTRVNGGFKTGETWTVKERLEDGRCVLERDGATKAFNPSSRGKWDIYRPETIELRQSQQVRITRGYQDGPDAFKNNDIAKVKEITEDRIFLQDGRSLPRSGAHLDQGTCITSHAAQCMTVDQCVPLLPMRSFSQVNAKSFYVYFSRARHKVVAFTDCKEALKEQVIERRGDRKSVWEHERDARRRQEPEQAKTEEKAREVADLQPEAIRQSEVYPARKVSAYERSLWKRAAEKYPVESRTAEQQKKLERKIAGMVQEHARQQPAPPAAYQQSRGQEYGMER